MTTGIKRRRNSDLTLSLSFNPEDQTSQDDSVETTAAPGMNRREVFSNSAKAIFAGLATPFVLDPTDPANALLLRFPIGPPQSLKNNYHFLRAGSSELEDEGIYSTNPLFLTNRENAMSDEGYKCLKPAIDVLKKTQNQPTVAYHSLAANGMDTGDLIARELKLGRDRLLPEFTYLDQRGIGLWDSSEESLTRHAVWAMDQMEAGAEGFGGRPPANTDGTPNDTLHDQFTRLRQFLSLQETRTSGDTILVIFPDGTGPALLSCMIAGIPYSEAHALEYKPGELRLDITPESIRELYEQRKDDPAYLAAIEDGKEKLKELRSMKSGDFSVSFKDSQSNEAQEAANEALIERQKQAALERQKADQERSEAMQEQMRIANENKRLKAEKRQQEELAKKQAQLDKLAAAKQKAEEAKMKRDEQFEASAAARAQGKGSDSASVFGMPVPVLATAAVGAVGAVFLAGGDDGDKTNEEIAVTTKKDDSGDGSNALKTAQVSTAVQEEAATSQTTMPVSIDKKFQNVPVANVTSVSTSAQEKSSNITSISEATTAASAISTKTTETQTAKPLTKNGKIEEASLPAAEWRKRPSGNKKEDKTSTNVTDQKDPEQEFASKLEAAEQELKNAFVEAADVKKKKQQQQPQQSPPKKSSLYDNTPSVIVTKAAPTKTTNYVYEDDEEDSDWLRVLSEIRDETEDDDDGNDFGTVDYTSLVNDAES